MYKLLIIIFTNFIFISLPLAEETETFKNSFIFDKIVIETKKGKNYSILVEIADKENLREKGLMYREVLNENSGMFFIFEKQKHVSFWMKNTFISLDLLFINSKGVITKIFRDSKPLSLQPIPSEKEVKGVIEVNAGFAKKRGIMVGDFVKHKTFK
ncbi:DUF192 domain-containing protein [Alphaproteobacteria bacterium]|nr:DUF192 domain-containing protein [Alphaproteobacteria bacterium]